jgi:hypothetical protein
MVAASRRSGLRWPGMTSLLGGGRALLALAVVLAAGGCVLSPAPFRPAAWSERSVEAPLPAAPPSPRLQVIVSYGGLMSSHTALRLEASEGRVVFWDPAGDYGRLTLEINPRFAGAARPVPRVADRLRDPPTLDAYLEFRWAMDDVGVEVFEWDLAPAHAEALREALLGRGRDPWGRTFSTLTAAPLCTVATGRFLERYGPPAVPLRGTYFFPHSLARALYSARPTRVLIFEPERAVRLYMPPTVVGPPRGPGAAARGPER